jgi:hypothetical protein
MGHSLFQFGQRSGVRKKRRATTANLAGAGGGEAGRGVTVRGEEGYLGFGVQGLRVLVQGLTGVCS